MQETPATKRVRLRAPRLSDARDVYENYASDPRVTRYMLWSTHASIDASERYLAYVINRNGTGAEKSWAITGMDNDSCIGMVSVIPDRHKAELGYVLAHDYWNSGVMTGVAQAIIRWCFENAGLTRVWATCADANLASARVLEKVGMQQEGQLRQWLIFPNLAIEPQDCRVYGIINTD